MSIYYYLETVNMLFLTKKSRKCLNIVTDFFPDIKYTKQIYSTCLGDILLC